jgi:O-antigen ligase
MLIFALIIPEMIFFSAFIKEKNEYRIMQNAVLWAGLLGIAAYILNIYIYGETLTRFGVQENQGALSLGRLFGMTAFTAFTLFFTREKHAFRGLYLILGIVYTGFLLGTGTRQSFFSLFGGLLIFFLFLLRTDSIKPRQIILLLVGIALIPLILSATQWFPLIVGSERIFDFTELFFQDPYTTLSSLKRVEKNFYSNALDLFWRSPLKGGGLGSFSMQYQGVDERLYPHNIFLEILSEMGILGLIPFLMILFMIIKKGINQIRTIKSSFLNQIGWLIGVWAIAFLNAQFTGDLVSNRLFWVLTAMVVAMSGSKKNRGRKRA